MTVFQHEKTLSYPKMTDSCYNHMEEEQRGYASFCKANYSGRKDFLNS